MARPSDPRFLTHHALRLKGFADTATVADVADRSTELVEEHLVAMETAGHAAFRDTRSLWQITADGRAAHRDLLAADLDGIDLGLLADRYGDFLEVNASFKQLCTDWQVRDGAPNDHTDSSYDADVLGRFAALHDDAVPIIASMSVVVGRLEPYGRRLERARAAVLDGETRLFTGVMCASYHDVWMELHEDLILTQGIDRSREGSF